MRRFGRDQRGFVFILALLVMPVFIGYAFIIIDIGRGNNAHADLQVAADSVALAGAAELDGGPDAIDRAKVAMANVTNTVSMLARSGSDMEISLVYEDTGGNEFFVTFLTDMPQRDTTPLTSAFLSANDTTDSALAEYVYVRAQSRDLDTAFFNPANLLSPTVPIAASAVAMAVSAACDIPPLYICNPFEFDSSGNYVGDQLQNEFQVGNLHGRLIRLHPPGASTQAPGNFGFLSVNGSSSANAINDIFAGNTNPTCYESGVVRTKPGAASAISQGINTRFDIYEGQYNNWNNATKPFPLAPAENVRKGSLPRINGNNIVDCLGNGESATKIVDDHIWVPGVGFNADGINDFAYGLPDNNTMLPPSQGIAGAYIGANSTWNAQTYLDRNYPAYPGGTPIVTTSNSTSDIASMFNGHLPSRYDVYRHEIDTGMNVVRAPGDPADSGDTGEIGLPYCGTEESSPSLDPVSDPDRRVMVAAIIDCTTVGDGGGVNYIPVNSYASIFLSRPMESAGPGVDSSIDVEIVDITGFGGNGTLEEFIREEAILVR
mgnify:CR=1 FL=1